MVLSDKRLRHSIVTILSHYKAQGIPKSLVWITCTCILAWRQPEVVGMTIPYHRPSHTTIGPHRENPVSVVVAMTSPISKQS